jgi:hypothetical protein
LIAPTNLNEIFGQIDIYLFDQLLRGRIPPGSYHAMGKGVGFLNL